MLIHSLPDLQAEVTVTGVDLVESTLDPKDLVKLSELKSLKTLLLPGPSFNPGAGSKLDANDQLKALASLTSLQKLHFSLHFLTNINVQDKGLASLAGLTQLKELRLAQTKVKGPEPCCVCERGVSRSQLYAVR